MSDWTEIKHLQSADGLRRIILRAKSGGLFGFTEETYLTEDGYSFWTPTGGSGLYDSAEAAERAARQETPWLRDEIATETLPVREQRKDLVGVMRALAIVATVLVGSVLGCAYVAFISVTGCSSRFNANAAAACGHSIALYEFLGLNPEWAYVKRADALIGHEQYEAGIADYSHAIRLNPKDVDALLGRGNAEVYLRRFDAAIKDFSSAIVLQPNNLVAFNNRFAAYLAKGDFGKAMQDADHEVRFDPGESDGFSDRAQSEWLSGDTDHALRDFDLAIKLDPYDSITLRDRCQLRAELGEDLQRALDDCNSAIQLDPTTQFVHTSLCLVFLRQARTKDGLAECDMALKDDPRDAAALYERGILKVHAGDAMGGNADMAASKKIDPKTVADLARFGVQP